MTISDLHLRSTVPQPAASGTRPAAPARESIDWRALRFARQACCCGARPAVVAVMPPAPGRPHPTDLLLCAHHYRAAARALAEAGATVFTMTGAAVGPEDLWRLGTAASR
jgi:hypothetical protein